MPERLPFSLLTHDAFQGEYIDEDFSSTYATKAEAGFEAPHLLEELSLESGENKDDKDSTYTLYIVGQEGERTFFTRG